MAPNFLAELALVMAVAVLGSFAALALAAQLDEEAPSWQERLALANSGLGLGITIWAVHFLSAGGASLPPGGSAGHIGPAMAAASAVVCAWAGLQAALMRSLGRAGPIAGGLVIGLGIAGTHYFSLGTPLAALLADDASRTFAVPSGIAVLGSIVAMWFAFCHRRTRATLASAAVLSIAMTLAFYLLAGVSFAGLLQIDWLDWTLPRPGLFSSVAIASVVLLSAGNFVLLTLIFRDGLSRRQVRLVQRSFKQVEPMASTAADLFYARLFEIRPHVRELFPADLSGQKSKLMTTLQAAVVSLHRLDAIVPVLRDLGKRHVRYGVEPADYVAVGEALLWTLARALGRDFTREIRKAWISAYGVLSATMIAGASEAVTAEQSVAQRDHRTSAAA